MTFSSPRINRSTGPSTSNISLALSMLCIPSSYLSCSKERKPWQRPCGDRERGRTRKLDMISQKLL